MGMSGLPLVVFITLVGLSTPMVNAWPARRLLQPAVCGTNCYYSTGGRCWPNPSAFGDLMPDTVTALFTNLYDSMKAEAAAQVVCCGATTTDACAAMDTCSWNTSASYCAARKVNISDADLEDQNLVCPNTFMAQYFTCQAAQGDSCALTPGCGSLPTSTYCVPTDMLDMNLYQTLTQEVSNYSAAVWGDCPNIQVARVLTSACNYTTSSACVVNDYCEWDDTTSSCSVTQVASLEVIVPNTGAFGAAFYGAYGSCSIITDAAACVSYDGPMNKGDPAQYAAPADLLPQLGRNSTTSGNTTSVHNTTSSVNSTTPSISTTTIDSSNTTGNFTPIPQPKRNSAAVTGASLAIAALAATAFALVLV